MAIEGAGSDRNGHRWGITQQLVVGVLATSSLVQAGRRSSIVRTLACPVRVWNKTSLQPAVVHCASAEVATGQAHLYSFQQAVPFGLLPSCLPTVSNSTSFVHRDCRHCHRRPAVTEEGEGGVGRDPVMTWRHAVLLHGAWSVFTFISDTLIGPDQRERDASDRGTAAWPNMIVLDRT